MPRHEVKQNVHTQLVSLLEQTDEVVICAVSGGYPAIVRNIVACIQKGRFKAGVYPYRRAAQLLDVWKLFGDAVYISDAVTVRVLEGLGIDLIKYCVVEPVRSFCHNNYLRINIRQGVDLFASV